MIRPLALVLILAAAALPGPAPAQNPGVDLIPADALAGFAIKNLDDFLAKGDKLAKDLKIPKNPLVWLTDVFKLLKLEKGMNMKGSAAAVIPNLEKLKVKLNSPPFLHDWQQDLETLFNHLVVILPVADADAIASNFGFKKGEWKLGTVKSQKFDKVDKREIKLLLTERFLYASPTEAAIKAVRESKPLPAALSEAQARSLRDADAALHLGPLALGDKLWGAFLADIERNLLLGDPDDDAIVKQATAAAKEIRSGTLVLRLEDGLTFDFILSFTKKNGAAAKFLTVMRGGPGTSDLNGLPATSAVAAYAARGDGTRNAHQARVLFKLILKDAFDLDVHLQADDRKKLLAAFDVLYKHLRGSRAAVYAVDAKKAGKVGQVAMVVILDLDDPAEHLSGWKNFIEVANKTSLKVNQNDAKKAPRFSFTPGAEKLDGLAVDVLAMENPKLDKGERDRNIKARGPDWDKIKMVTVGKQIVALFGSSDMDLLRAAVKNVKEGNKGLADNKAMAAHLKTLPAERKIEFHGQGGFFLAAFGQSMAAKERVNSWVSAALVVEPDRLQVRVRLPLAALKALPKQGAPPR